jgi:bacteriocin biosynthesis cyclodehydratase domain-containing protein
MIQKPKLKTFLTVFPISSTTWGLRGGSEELWRIKLRDESAIRTFSGLLPYLNGQHEVADILVKVGEQGLDAATAQKLLEHFESTSLIEETDSTELSPEDADRYEDQITFFSRFSSEGGAKYQQILRQARVAVVGDGGLSRSVQRHLGESGFGEVIAVRGGGAPAPVPHEGNGNGASSSQGSSEASAVLALDRVDIWPEGEAGELPLVFIVPQEAHDPQLLEAMDALSKKHGVPWLLVRSMDPREGWVGPLFIPGETASYVSLEARLRGNAPHFEEYQAFDNFLRSSGGPSPACGGLHTFHDLLSGIAVTEVIKFVTGISVPQLAGRFLTIDLMTWATEMHDVLRIPRLEAEYYNRPRIFPWKEIPYGDKQTRRA